MWGKYDYQNQHKLTLDEVEAAYNKMIGTINERIRTNNYVNTEERFKLTRMKHSLELAIEGFEADRKPGAIRRWR